VLVGAWDWLAMPVQNDPALIITRRPRGVIEDPLLSLVSLEL
jgi:hypothetical protein